MQITGKLESANVHDKGIELVITKTTAQTLGDEVGMFFKNEKYKLEKGTPLAGDYGRGNAVLRILLGAFVPRYKFNVRINEQGNQQISLSISKGMSGASGGVIGASKMKKETLRIAQQIQAICQK